MIFRQILDADSSCTICYAEWLRSMPATVVLGAQWGDEGKGKLVDRLAESATWVARFQGGNNAGHTVVLGDKVLKFHLLPSGITREECGLVLGDGMVIDPWVLDRELNELSKLRDDALTEGFKISLDTL